MFRFRSSVLPIAFLATFCSTGCEDSAVSRTSEDLDHLVLTLCDGGPTIIAKSNIERAVERFDYTQKKFRKSKTDWIQSNCEFLLYTNGGAESALENIRENGIFFGFVDHLLIAENAEFEVAKGISDPLGVAILSNTIPFSDKDLSISFEAAEARVWTDVQPSDFQWSYVVGEFRSGKIERELSKQNEDESGAQSLVMGRITDGPQAGKSIVLIKLTSEWSL